MSSQAPRIEVTLPHMRIAIVATLWNENIVDQLIDGAQDVLGEASMETHVFRVSGAFELPLVVAQSLKNFDAAIALGVVIRGDTAHFDYICQSVTDGLTRVVLDERKPVGFGVLMVENEEQALVRCHKDNNKGAESAEAVLLSLQKLLEIKG